MTLPPLLTRVEAARKRLPANVRKLGWISLANDAASELAYPIVLLGQLIVWLRELEQSVAESVVSPELMLVDPELRRLASLAAEPPEPEREPERTPIDPERPASFDGDARRADRPRFPTTAGAYVLRASIRTAVIDLAFFVLLACIVLLISIR